MTMVMRSPLFGREADFLGVILINQDKNQLRTPRSVASTIHRIPLTSYLSEACQDVAIFPVIPNTT